jgi:hypothetical protein
LTLLLHDRFRRFPPINNIEENMAFCESLRKLLDDQ